MGEVVGGGLLEEVAGEVVGGLRSGVKTGEMNCCGDEDVGLRSTCFADHSLQLFPVDLSGERPEKLWSHPPLLCAPLSQTPLPQLPQQSLPLQSRLA